MTLSSGCGEGTVELRADSGAVTAMLQASKVMRAKGLYAIEFPARPGLSRCGVLKTRLSLILLFFLIFAPASAQPGPPQGGLEKLEIITSSGTHEFLVEVMRNERQRERGLMFRRFLPPERGMLFDFEAERPVTMWMKNTYLPLDMIFISRSGLVTRIAENTEPLSEKIISSGSPVYAVLEVNAGTAARIGLKTGNRVRHSIFQKQLDGSSGAN
ncbi:MAG TPA: DUF192 domain-containing protein [Methylocella sp.]|nr:DUF192 domain-containing protein [Methylocella sp.]